jgi:TorA maturation chaperone TorD
MTEKNNSSLELDTNLSAEDLARADLYGLLALLFYAPPPTELLEKITHFSQEMDSSEVASTSLLQGPWNELVELAKSSQAEEWADEYETSFIGVGKQEIFLYGSFYLTGFLNERPLVALRHDLERMGLEGSEDITETEDHIACLCEVMRYLIAGEDLSICNLTQQKQFFNQHIRVWVNELFDILESYPHLKLYRAVGELARIFFEIEGQAFDMV